MDNINKETITRRCYPAKGPRAITMFCKPKIDKPLEPRFLLDCKERNLVTEKDKTPLPSIDEIIALCNRNEYRSKLDMTDACYLIRIEPEDEQYSTFLTEFGYLNSRVMQQGDCNAPATMMKVMTRLFGPELGDRVMVYLDDIIVGSPTYKEHVKDLRKVCERLRDNGFYLNKDKCEILPREMNLLGHTLTKEGLKASKGKIQQVKDFPTPKTKKEVQSFLGIINYLARFSPEIGKEATPLINISGSTAIWKWTPLEETAFEKYKKLVLENRVIRPINHESEDPVYLVTDARLVEIGAWIGQGPPREIRPAKFYTKKFSPTQMHYLTYDKELLAIICGLQHFRSQLVGYKVIILTDHKPLTSFMKQDQETERKHKYQEILSQFDHEIRHVKGEENILSDTLSRIYKSKSWEPSRYQILQPPCNAGIIAGVI